MLKPATLFHATTPKKVRLYKQTGYICAPVRGFTTLQAALAWACKTGRTVVLEIEPENEANLHKLPDHHNIFGQAWWHDGNIRNWKCAFSAESDA